LLWNRRLGVHQTRVEDLPLVLPLHRSDVGFGHLCRRLPWSWVHAELDHRLLDPRRTNGIASVRTFTAIVGRLSAYRLISYL
jgi:hypothetical protein